jgi:hypothetical protein
VIDANNYYRLRDGVIADLETGELTAVFIAVAFRRHGRSSDDDRR